MANLDGVMNTAKKYFDKAVVKTGEAVEGSKLYIDKTQVKSKLNQLYESLGKAHYSTDTNQKNESELIQSLMQQIHDTLSELQQVNSKITGNKGIVCKVCGRKNTPDSSFCEGCGETLKK